MRESNPLNARQLDVLRRISSSEDVGTDPTAKTSARALHGRGLVVVSTRGGWHAEITDAGRFYLDHGHHPARQCDSSCVPTTATPPTSFTPKRKPPHTTARVTARRRQAATDLLARLLDEKRVMISNPDDDEIAEWRRTVDFAKRHGMVPDGKRIEKTRLWGGDLRIALLDGGHFNTKPPLDPAQRVDVPDHVDQLHPLLSHLRNPAVTLNVSPEQAPRALRIMHTVLTEVERRGYNTGWAEDTSEGVEIRHGDFRLQVTMAEEREQRDVLPTPEELAGKKTYAWQRVQPESTWLHSGKLRIQVSTSGARWDRTSWWADRKRWRVEDKLSELIAEVTRRVQAERDRLAAEERARIQRQRDWEAAMTDARARFQEDRRIDALNKQLDSWGKASAIRAYCSATEKAQAAGKGVEEPELQASWLDWCRAYADRIDPTKSGAGAPQEVEPSPSDLKPYLGKFNPYGP